MLLKLRDFREDFDSFFKNAFDALDDVGRVGRVFGDEATVLARDEVEDK